MSVYPWLRPLLFRLEAERAHRTLMGAVRAGARVPGWYALERAVFAYDHPALRVSLWGRDFPNPVGLAAGFDKDGLLLASLLGLGFGFVEAGTVTPRPQPGNPRPRLFRLVEDRAIINRMGFNNAGVAALADRLRVLRPAHPGARIGVNLGKNKDTPLERAAEDYRAGMEAAYPLASYLVINVSSPNTPGLRNLQARAELAAVVGPLAQERSRRTARGEPHIPLLIKVAPELTEAELADAVAVALDAGLDGIVATNTTLARDGLRSAYGAEGGGLSGSPLHARAVNTVAAIHRLGSGRLPIVGVGGVSTARDAYDFILAGASLVQLYTALIYQGPGLVKRIKRGLVALLEQDGFASVGEAVGSGSATR